MEKTLSSGMTQFRKLNVSEQCEIISQILLLTAIGGYTANLKKIEGAPTAGKVLIGKKIGNQKSVLLINQSVTGLYQSEINLLTV